MRRRVGFLAAALILAPLPTAIQAQNHAAIDEASEPRFLTVVSAASGSVDGDTLTLNGVPAVVYFSDRPARIAGQMSVDDYVAGWDQGSDSFAADPPNAVLSILGADDIVVELASVALDGDTLTFEVAVIDGTLPTSFGSASLFVDDYCRKNPLTCP